MLQPMPCPKSLYLGTYHRPLCLHQQGYQVGSGGSCTRQPITKPGGVHLRFLPLTRVLSKVYRALLCSSAQGGQPSVDHLELSYRPPEVHRPQIQKCCFRFFHPFNSAVQLQGILDHATQPNPAGSLPQQVNLILRRILPAIPTIPLYQCSTDFIAGTFSTSFHYFYSTCMRKSI